MGAERILAAEKGERKIAVEIKSFVGASEMNDLENALGQFIFYRAILAENEPDRELYLAVPDEIFKTVFEKEFYDLLVKNNLAKVFGVNRGKGGNNRMDKLEQMRETVEKVLLDYTKPPFAEEGIESEVVFDRERDCYLLVEVGWENGARVHHTNVHL